MKKRMTNLSYLMSLCNIRGVEISKHLHVDQSLVGKWKNGTRNIAPDSGYIYELIDFFIEQSGDKVEALLMDIYKDQYEPDRLRDHLRTFICSKDPKLMAKTVLHKDLEADSSALYYSYEGVEGRKKAMDYLMDCAGSLEDATTIYLYDSSCFDWLINSEAYFYAWGKRILTLLSKDSNIYLIIDSDTDPKAAAKLLFHFYPFSANRHFNIYYVDGINYPTAYILGGLLAVTGYNDYSEEHFCTQVFTDYSAIRQQELYMRHLLRCRKKDSIKRFTAADCFANIKNLQVVSSDIYMFSVTPTLYTMPPELMDKVLSYNTALDERVKKRLREYNCMTSDEFFSTDKNKRVRCIFPLEELTNKAKQTHVVYADNLYSDIATLYVRAEDYRAHLRFLAKQIQENNNYQIGITPDIEHFGSDLAKLGYFASKKQCWAIMSNEHSGTKALFFMNAALVDLFFLAQDYVWNNIPESYTGKENVVRILNGIASLPTEE